MGASQSNIAQSRAGQKTPWPGRAVMRQKIEQARQSGCRPSPAICDVRQSLEFGIRRRRAGARGVSPMTWLDDQTSGAKAPGERLSELWRDAGIVAIPGAHNALAALIAKKAGFKALYLSGAA